MKGSAIDRMMMPQGVFAAVSAHSALPAKAQEYVEYGLDRRDYSMNLRLMESDSGLTF
jgi:hypothetical protein